MTRAASARVLPRRLWALHAARLVRRARVAALLRPSASSFACAALLLALWLLHALLTSERTATAVSGACPLCERCGFAASSLVLITSAGAQLVNGGGLSVFKRRHDVPLVLFHEDSWDTAHGRAPLRRELVPPGVCLVDIFDAEPWLHDALRSGGELDEFYAYAGAMEPCDQPLRVKSGKLLVRKLASMWHALKGLPPGVTLLWLDSDVLPRRRVDMAFMSFVRRFDVAFIPFTSNKLWGDAPSPDFADLSSPFWRIESGVVAFTVSDRATALVSDVVSHYRGALLRHVRHCLERMPHLPGAPCNETWFRRNVYLDDIFVFSLVLHKAKASARLGWFSVGRGPQCGGLLSRALRRRSRYPFPHVCQRQTPYTSPFDLDAYFQHRIGSGAYSTAFRRGVQTRVDAELLFSPAELFNDTLEFRFAGSGEAELHDTYWGLDTLAKRQAAGLWPEGAPLTLRSGPARPTLPQAAELAGLVRLSSAHAPLVHTHAFQELEAPFIESTGALRPRGAVVILARSGGGALLETLDRLYRFYNERHQDDVWVVHTGVLNTEAQARLAATYPLLRVHLMRNEDWHAGVALGGVAVGLSDEAAKAMPWNAFRLWRVLHAHGYEYIARLDEGAMLLSTVPYNLFTFMRANGFAFAYRNVVRDLGADGGTAWFDFLRGHIDAHLDTSGWLLDACAESELTHHNCRHALGFHGAFAVAETAFFLQPAVQHFLAAVDGSGLASVHDWTDSMVFSAAVQLFLMQPRVHRFVGWGVAHVLDAPDAAQLQRGIVQAGAFDPQPASTVLAFCAERGTRLVRTNLTLQHGTLVTYLPQHCIYKAARWCLG